MGRRSSGRARSQRGRVSLSSSAGPGLLLAVTLLLTMLSWPLALGPLLRLADTLGWPENHCTIQSVEWRENRGARLKDRHPTLHLHYRYQLDGRMHDGSAVNVTELDDGLAIREGRRRDQPAPDYRVGATHRCWTEPHPPYRAVLERRVTALPWLLSGVLALLLVAGLGALLRSGRSR